MESPFLPVVNYTNYLLDQWDDIQSVCSTSIPLSTSLSTLYQGRATATPTPTAVARRFIQVVAPHIVSRSIAGYADLGCYTDANDRTLSGDNESTDNLSIESCASFCSEGGYQIFGVENGDECWCSNTISSTATLQDSSNCNSACNGSPQEICGGGWAINLYSSTTVATPSGTPTPAIGSVSGFGYAGCYIDADDRTLSGSSTTDSSLTLEECAATCSGEAFFGVEYGVQCYCGSSINSAATISTDCNMACGGNDQDLCGGSWAMDIYSAASAPTGPVSTAMPTTTTPSSPATTTCSGQLVDTAGSDGIPFGCATLAQQYNVSTGAVMFATNDKLCDVDMQACLPLGCTVDRIGFTETCASLVEAYYTEANNLTLATFLSWNPYFVGFCQLPLGGQYVCIDPPGGAVTLDVPVYNPTGTTGYYTTATPPQPTSTGTTADCALYYSVSAGDVCQTICLRYGISFDAFRAMNTQLLPDCSNLWIGYSYCVYNVSAPQISDDGTCGTENNNAVCEGSGFGDCCNKSGACGSGDAYCAEDLCQSGACLNGTLTPDGSCGKLFLPSSSIVLY